MTERRDAGAGVTQQGAPSPAPPGVPPVRPSLWKRLELFNLKTPFRLKLLVVWIGIAAVLATLFALVEFDTQWMRENWWYIARGIPWTLILSAGGIVLAVTLALLGALARLSRNSIAYGVSGFYVSFFRGTPLIVQMFLIYSALPQLGGALEERGLNGARELLTIDPLPAGVIALGLNYGAYMTEIFRAGIESVAHGQREAAEALGMTYRQAMRRIVLPQAVRVIIPPTGNEFIAMLKDSALVSFLGTVVSQMEIFRRAQLLGRRDFQPLEAFVLAAALYWILTGIFTYFQRRLERRVSRGYVRSASIVPGGGSGEIYVSK